MSKAKQIALYAKQKSAHAAAVVTSAVLSLPVYAQETDPIGTAVTDAFTTIETKVGTFAAGLIGLAVIGTIIGVGVKYVKKGRGAA